MPEEDNKISGVLNFRNIRDLLGICLMLVVTWKLINAEISISIKEFTFSDLLSVFLAFFAIALSVAFYFKATDTSNKFYDNSYKFTKEISEILGRIEAGFGEKLKHLDEGYSGIRDKFDQLPFNETKANEEVEEEKQEIKRKAKEQEELLENLAQKAKLDKAEKTELFEKMAKTNSELEEAKLDLRRMQRNIVEHKASKASPERKTRVLRYLAKKISNEVPPGLEKSLTKSSIREIFSNIKEDLHPEAMEDLHATGLVDEEGVLTTSTLLSLKIRIRKDL